MIKYTVKEIDKERRNVYIDFNDSENNVDAFFMCELYSNGDIDINTFLYGRIRRGNNLTIFQNFFYMFKAEGLSFTKSGRGRLSEKDKNTMTDFIKECQYIARNIKID